MKNLIYLFLISANAFALEAPVGRFEFKGRIGLVSSLEIVRVPCKELRDYRRDGFECELAGKCLRFPDEILRCSRKDEKSDFYKDLLDNVEYDYHGSYVEIQQASGAPEFEGEKFDRRSWKIPAKYIYAKRSYKMTRPHFYYSQSPGHPDQFGPYQPGGPEFKVAGPGSIWHEQSWQGESKDSHGHIVWNSVTYGLVYEK